MLPAYLLRLLDAADQSETNFIRSTWQHVHHLANTDIPQEIYLPEQTKIIDHLLKNSHTLLAVFPEDPTTIMGYVCYDVPEPYSLIIHWAHVKSPYRRQGLYSDMLKHIDANYQQHIIITTHNSPNKITNHFYNPFVLRKYLYPSGYSGALP